MMRLAATAAILAIALPATAFATQTGTNVTAEKPGVDRVVTGSINALDRCEAPAFGPAGACVQPGGETIKYPSAPINPRFGF